MTEKVLGIREKDLNGNLRMVKSVHVVSLEWLEKRLGELEARSVFEILPAYNWADNTARNVYMKGARETETAWHKLIRDLLSAAKKEVGK